MATSSRSAWYATRTAVAGASAANAASLSVISYGYAPRERYMTSAVSYEDRGGIGFRAPGVSVGIGTNRW